MLFLSTPLVQPNRAPAPLWVEGMERALPLGFEEQFLSVLESFHTLALKMPIFGLCIVINQIFPQILQWTGRTMPSGGQRGTFGWTRQGELSTNNLYLKKKCENTM